MVKVLKNQCFSVMDSMDICNFNNFTMMKKLLLLFSLLLVGVVSCQSRPMTYDDLINLNNPRKTPAVPQQRPVFTNLSPVQYQCTGCQGRAFQVLVDTDNPYVPPQYKPCPDCNGRGYIVAE